MKVERLMTNQMKDPVGYHFSHLTLSWQLTEAVSNGLPAIRVRIGLDPELDSLVHDSGRLEAYGSCRYHVKLKLRPRTVYYWRVMAENEADGQAESQTALFETGKETESWNASWIGASGEGRFMPLLYRDFVPEGAMKSARLYVCGLGLYEVWLNGEKAGDEYLMPGYHSYDSYLEYQTVDVTPWLRQGRNRLSILLGNGWYMGRFGFDGYYENLYGSRRKCIAELHILYEDGREECIGTGPEWRALETCISDNNIYDGEVIDELHECRELQTELLEEERPLTARTSLPLRKTERFAPVSAKWQEDGTLLLDFGESITGWVEWSGCMKMGQQVRLSYGELLQQGRFYRDNLRTAKAEFTFRSAGANKTARPHFTYFGFRYVRVEGVAQTDNLIFTAYRLMSDIPVTGSIVTSDSRLNKLLENTLRSQKCNFLDIPTDCPQRDERMGWTGDAGIFCGTACFHMDSSAFFAHYLRCMAAEQELLGGAVPFFAPLPKVIPCGKMNPVGNTNPEGRINPFYVTAGAAVWGDAATILPMCLYDYYGDRELLREQFPIMCSWVDYVAGRAAENTVPYLWQNDRQLGDWLALDNGNPQDPRGKTDAQLIASAYFYLSASLCARAAGILKDGREKKYRELAVNIRQAFLSYYFREGELQGDITQTACALLLKLGLYPEKGGDYLASRLLQQLQENGGLLNTGFVGTPALCPSLSDAGCNDSAYRLLLNEACPGWLFEVKQGATTVWERWNSVLEDGTISGTGMNSLNHYAYGSIGEWMYRYMCGFRPQMGEDIPMELRPMPDSRLGSVTGRWNSVWGEYVCGWTYEEELGFRYRVEIPYPASAKIVFPSGVEHLLGAGVYYFDGNGNRQTNHMT